MQKNPQNPELNATIFSSVTYNKTSFSIHLQDVKNSWTALVHMRYVLSLK